MTQRRDRAAEAPPQRDGRLRLAGSRGIAAGQPRPTPRRDSSGASGAAGPGQAEPARREGGSRRERPRPDARPTPRPAANRPARDGGASRKARARAARPERDAASARPSRSAGRRPASARATRASRQARPSASRTPRRRPNRRFLALAAALVLVAGIFLVRAVLALKDSAPTTHTASVAWTGEAPGVPATPQKLWARGSLPYLYQTDEAWAAHPYGNDDVATSGCGPTCLSMVYIALTGDTSMGPAAMADYSTAGGYVEQGMTAWRLMTDGAAALGLYSRELWIDRDMVTAALESGAYVVVNVEPGDFTTVGHYMVIEGLDEDGLAILHDPNSAYNSLKRWPLGQILSQTSNLWALSA